MDGAPTLRDIARETGVSVSTVSRALNGSGRVSKETRTRIERAATAFGYDVRPNAVSGALRTRELTIGVVVTDLADYYVFDALTGLCSTVQAAGHRLDLTDLTENEFDTSAIQRAAAACDGLVLMSPRIDEAVLREFCDPARTVLTHRRLEGYSSVALEESSGMQQALRHLASLGHKRIAYVAGPEESWANRRRQQSFEQHCGRMGIEPVVFGPFRPSYEGGVIAADTVMMEEAITAVIAYNDLVASGLVVRLMERGIRVPEDMSVVGMDDSILAQVLRPQLTSVSTLQTKVGKTAAQIILMLLTQRAGRGAPASGAEGAQSVLMPEGFVVRGSTGLARPAS